MVAFGGLAGGGDRSPHGEEERACLVRVLGSGGRTVGVGFAVRGNDGRKLILTCSHCVQPIETQKPGLEPPAQAEVVLAAGGSPAAPSVVEVEQWSPYAESDVAILVPPPALARLLEPLDLARSKPAANVRFEAFGFPPDGNPAGQWAVGELGKPVGVGSGAGIQLNLAEAITGGFSGSPVVEARTGTAVAMVSRKWEPHGYASGAPVAFAIPSEALRELFDSLALTTIVPYQDLAAFSEKDAGLFFGRAELTKALAAILGSTNPPVIATVLGHSGSGKSSLVKAGLIPRLVGTTPNGHPHAASWHPIMTRPAEVVHKNSRIPGSRGPLTIAQEAHDSRQDSGERVLLVIDQFEELLTANSDEAIDRYIGDVAALIADPPGPVTVLIVMRSSFVDRLVDGWPRFAELVDGAPSLSVPAHLSRSELVDIVCEPAKHVGVCFEPGLVDRIVGDAIAASRHPTTAAGTARATVLPLLEVALTDLWGSFLDRGDARLTHSSYEQVGGVAGALPYRAASAYAALTDDPDVPSGIDGQGLARRILMDLVHAGDEVRGVPDSRRRRLRRELSRGPDEDAAVEAILQYLASHRLIVSGTDSQ